MPPPLSAYAEQLPVHMPVQVPEQDAAALSSASQLPLHSPSHATDGAVTVHLRSALASHLTSAVASTSQPPLHSTIAEPGSTLPSQCACASSVAWTSASQRAGSASTLRLPSTLAAICALMPASRSALASRPKSARMAASSASMSPLTLSAVVWKLMTDWKNASTDATPEILALPSAMPPALQSMSRPQA